MTGYVGIDYGMGITNIDTETGIRYETINLNRLSCWASEEFEPVYGDEDTNEDVNDFVEPIGWRHESDGCHLIMHEDGDVIVLKSPLYTNCKFCSPCFPGGGDLSSPSEEGVKTYCLGPEWFENEVAPYPIHSC